MRGYRILKSKNELDTLIKLKKQISETKIKAFPNKLLYNENINELESSIKQFLLLRLLQFDFNKKLLITISKNYSSFYHPLPFEWRIVLEKNGFKANNFINKLIWNFYIVAFFSYGLLNNLERIFKTIKQIFVSTRILNIHNSIYFHQLTKNNIVFRNNSDNIISWFDSYNKDKSIKNYIHNLKNIEEFKINNKEVNYIESVIPLPQNFISFIKFLNWSIYSSLVSVFDFINGRYFSFIMYNELSMSYLIRAAKDNRIPKKIMFHQTGYLFKPIWTYDAERKGSIVYLYFYATGIKSPDFKNSNGIQGHFFKDMTWKNYLVWDIYQEKFIQNITFFDSIIEVVGPIKFSSGLNPKINNKKSISLFDIQPFRDSWFQISGNETDYYKVDTAIKFIKDIVEIANEYGFTVYHKRKRDITNTVLGYGTRHIKYINFLKKISMKYDNFFSLHPETDAYAMIRKTEITISMPFTSTSIYAKHVNVPTFYYDPIDLVKKNDPAAHGIKTLTNSLELKDWFKKNFAKKT